MWQASDFTKATEINKTENKQISCNKLEKMKTKCNENVIIE